MLLRLGLAATLTFVNLQAASLSIAELRALAKAGAAGDKQYVVRGTVTMRPGVFPDDPNVMYLQDLSGGLAVELDRPADVRPGDELEVSGRLKLLEIAEPELLAANWRVLRHDVEVQPKQMTAAEAVKPRNVGLLARVHGRVEKVAVGKRVEALYIGREPELLRVYIRRPAGASVSIVDDAPPGSEVEAVGILLPSTPSQAQLRLRDGQDLMLIRGPVFWTTARALWLGAGLAVVWLLFSLWVVTLRRSLARRTAEIQMLLDQALEASRLKSQFLANISHEIRTPVHGILGMQSMLLESGLSGEQRDQLEIAQASATHLLHLLNDVLDFARIEAGRVTLAEEEFSPAEALEEAVSGFAAQAREKGLALTLDASGLPERVAGDAMRLRQILINLLSNAVKFTERGFVRAKARSEELASGEYEIELALSDSGIGIEEDKRGIIFDSFRQADGSITRRFGGSGLGLSIVAGLVEKMGGSITVDSELGRGSMFRARMRFKRPKERPAEPEPAQQTAPRRLRILLAEDNAVNQLVARRPLEQRGHEVVVVDTGLAALVRAVAEPFDVILMDVQMPEMDGLEATRAIREQEQWTGRRVSIAALTAHSFKDELDKCLDAGIDECLSKPFQASDLLALVERLAPARPAAAVVD